MTDVLSMAVFFSVLAIGDNRYNRRLAVKAIVPSQGSATTIDARSTKTVASECRALLVDNILLKPETQPTGVALNLIRFSVVSKSGLP
jgi:hypothetical protein